jgi:hypothetical protein
MSWYWLPIGCWISFVLGVLLTAVFLADRYRPPGWDRPHTRARDEGRGREHGSSADGYWRGVRWLPRDEASEGRGSCQR